MTTNSDRRLTTSDGKDKHTALQTTSDTTHSAQSILFLLLLLLLCFYCVVVTLQPSKTNQPIPVHKTMRRTTTRAVNPLQHLLTITSGQAHTVYTAHNARVQWQKPLPKPTHTVTQLLPTSCHTAIHSKVSTALTYTNVPTQTPAHHHTRMKA